MRHMSMLFGAAAILLTAGAVHADTNDALVHEDGTVVVELMTITDDGLMDPFENTINDEIVRLLADEGFGGFVIIDFDDDAVLPDAHTFRVERHADRVYPSVGDSPWHIVHGYLVLPDGTLWRSVGADPGGSGGKLQVGVDS